MAIESTPSSQFMVEPRPSGSVYIRPEDYTPRYEEHEPIISSIANNIRNFFQVETTLRLVVEGPLANKQITVISVPFEGTDDVAYNEMAGIVFDQLWGYYVSVNPRTTHHGLTHLVFDGNETSLVRREIEKFLALLPHRTDLSHRVMKNYRMEHETTPFERDSYMKESISKVLTMHLGVRMYTFGYGVNRQNLFLPIHGGKNALERIYYNLEHIIHQNLVAYDETHDHCLPVSEELVFRELEGILDRARKKVNTRRKIIDGLKVRTVLIDDPANIHTTQLADLYYDKINRIDLLDEASARSRDLFATSLIRSSEMINESLDTSQLKLETQKYVPREKIVGDAPTAASESYKSKILNEAEAVVPAMSGLNDDE